MRLPHRPDSEVGGAVMAEDRAVAGRLVTGWCSTPQAEVSGSSPLLAIKQLVGSAGGAWAVRRVLARLARFPPAATSNRACGSPAHGSPTFFTAGIQRPGRHGRLGRGATMVLSRLINPSRSGDW